MCDVFEKTERKKNTKITLSFLLLLVMLFVFIAQTKNAVGTINFHAKLFEKKETIVIDAGHGGEDGGAVAVNGINEKDINLAIALALQDILVQNNYEVIMIRDGDYAVGDTSLGTVAERKRSDINARLQTIVEAGECIYVGIHQSHFSESKYYGAQVFYSGNRTESELLAECIRLNIVSSLQPDNTREKKLATSDIYILDHSPVPAVLVECGFLSNPEENDKLSDPDYQVEMAEAIYAGLIDYFISLPREDSSASDESSDTTEITDQ